MADLMADHKFRGLTNVVKAMTGGGSLTVGTVSLTNGTTTVVEHPGVNHESHINLEPTNAAAATEKAAGTMYVSKREKDKFTITHSASAAARTFTYEFKHFASVSVPYN